MHTLFSQVFMKPLLPSRAMIMDILKHKLFPDYPDLGGHGSMTHHNVSIKCQGNRNYKWSIKETHRLLFKYQKR